MIRNVLVFFHHDFLVTGFSKFNILLSLKAALNPLQINRKTKTKDQFIL